MARNTATPPSAPAWNSFGRNATIPPHNPCHSESRAFHRGRGTSRAAPQVTRFAHLIRSHPYNSSAMNLEQKLEELKKRDRLAEEGGGAQRRERQHKEGKMSARERIEFLLDEGSFEETDKLVTHRSSDFGMAAEILRRRIHHRL